MEEDDRTTFLEAKKEFDAALAKAESTHKASKMAHEKAREALELAMATIPEECNALKKRRSAEGAEDTKAAPPEQREQQRVVPPPPPPLGPHAGEPGVEAAQKRRAEIEKLMGTLRTSVSESAKLPGARGAGGAQQGG